MYTYQMYTYLMSFWRTLYAHFTCQNNKTTFLRLTVFKKFQLSDYSFIQKKISFFYRLLPKCQKQIPIPKPRLQTKPLLATVFRNFINRIQKIRIFYLFTSSNCSGSNDFRNLQKCDEQLNIIIFHNRLL